MGDSLNDLTIEFGMIPVTRKQIYDAQITTVEYALTRDLPRDELSKLIDMITLPRKDSEMSLTAEDLVTLLNGGKPVTLENLELCVITKINDGSVAHPFFNEGEILVVDKFTGREPWGEGRKPAKWDIEAEYVSSLAEAQVIRDRVLGADSAV